MTYCFPAVLCSRFSFRLSVRQVVSRVILRGSALHYFAQRPIWAHCVDCFFPKQFLHFFQRRLFLAAQKEQRIAVADDCISTVLVNRFELRLRLKHNACRNFSASDGRNQALKVRDLPDIGKLIDQAAHMHRKPAAVLVIRLFAKEVEHLAVRHGNQEVEAAVGVGHDQEQRCALFPDGVQVQLVIFRDLPQLLNVKGRKPRAAADQDAFGGLARDKLSRTF